MSICIICGTDQETGLRVGLEDDLAPAATRPVHGPPFHVAIDRRPLHRRRLDPRCVLAVIESTGTNGRLEQYGWLCLALVSGFGIYAAVQFIRGKSAKLLISRLTLGVMVDVMALVALPIVKPIFEDPDQHRQPDVKPGLGRLERCGSSPSRNGSTSRGSGSGSA